MGDYSFVKDANGTVCGIWLRDPGALERPGLVEVLLMKDNLTHLLGPYLNKRYEVFDNSDSSGGCFVMFGGASPPGE